MRQLLMMAVGVGTAMTGMTPAMGAEPPCAALPAELAGWATKAAVVTPGRLMIGKAAELTLMPTPTVRYAVTPEKPGAPESFGGTAGFTAAHAGRYRVALGGGVWIDVVRDGKLIASSAHGHGPACSGVRKMVDFTLAPGRYVLQVAGASGQSVSVMIAQLR